MTIENERVVQNRVIASNINAPTSNVNAPTSNVNTPTSKGTSKVRFFFEVRND